MHNQTSLDEAWAPGTAASTAFATATNVYFWQSGWVLRVLYIATDPAANNPFPNPITLSGLNATFLAADKTFVTIKQVTVSLTATAPAPTTPTYVASADLNTVALPFYVTGTTEVSNNFVAVKLAGPNYLKCSQLNNYGTNYYSNDIVVYDFDQTYVCYTPLLVAEVYVDSKSAATAFKPQLLASETSYVKICIPGSCW